MTESLNILDDNYPTLQSALAPVFRMIYANQKPVFIKVNNVYLYIEPTTTVNDILVSYKKRLQIKHKVSEKTVNKYGR